MTPHVDIVEQWDHREVDGRQRRYWSLLGRMLCQCGPHFDRRDAGRCLSGRMQGHHRDRLRRLPKAKRFEGKVL